jgi:hypothetical protein
MAKPGAKKPDEETGGLPFTPRRILSETYRGILFDILIFLVSIFLMKVLTDNFVELVGAADRGDDQIAQLAVGFFCLGIFLLPPAAALLKRYHFHQKLAERNKKFSDEKTGFLFGCLFNPIFYFCLNVVIVSAVNAFIMQLVYGKKEPGAGLFVTLVFAGLVFNILQTYLVYHFFTPPKREPRSEFLKSHRAALLGDLCIS